MDFKFIFTDFLISFIQFFRRVFLLVVSPYKTMRTIYFDGTYKETYFIFMMIFIYFNLSNYVKNETSNPVLLLAIVLVQLIMTISFFGIFSKIINLNKKFYFKKYFTLFSYSLIPTIVFFYVNTLLYGILPPPRSNTVLAEIFSIMFISFATSIFFWKIIILYLAVRYSTALKFFTILYTILIYISIVLPYSILLLKLNLFRIPFL